MLHNSFNFTRSCQRPITGRPHDSNTLLSLKLPLVCPAGTLEAQSQEEGRSGRVGGLAKYCNSNNILSPHNSITLCRTSYAVLMVETPWFALSNLAPGVGGVSVRLHNNRDARPAFEDIFLWKSCKVSITSSHCICNTPHRADFELAISKVTSVWKV